MKFEKGFISKGKEIDKPKEEDTSRTGKAKRTLGAAGGVAKKIAEVPLTLGVQGIGRALSKAAEIEKGETRKVAQSLAGTSVQKKLEKMRDPMALRGEKIGALIQMIEEHQLDDAKAKMSERELRVFNEEIKEIAGAVASIGDRASFMEILRANPHLANEVITGLDSKTKKEMKISEPNTDEFRAEYKANKNKETLDEIDEIRKSKNPLKWRKADKMMNEFLKEKNYSFIPQVIRGIKPEDVGKIAGEALGIRGKPELRTGESEEDFKKRKEKYDDTVKEVWDAIYKEWLPDQITAAIKTFKKSFAEKYMEGAKERGIMWYVLNNPAMATYMASPLASKSGLFPLENVTLQQINNWLDKLNRLSPEIRNTFKEQFNRLKDEQRKTLTEALKKNPDRLSDGELKGASLEEKITEWTTNKDKK